MTQQTPSYDDFIAFLDSEPSLGSIRKDLIADCREASCYDLGDLLSNETGVAFATSLVAERLDKTFTLVIDAVGPFLFRWATAEHGLFGFGYTGGRADPLTAMWSERGFVLFPGLGQSQRANGEWRLSEGVNPISDGLVFAALALIDEAEANNGENVEFVERSEVGATGMRRRLRRKYNRVRTISLTQTRKQYLGLSKPHQGGTHARPCEHIRVLTERTITPKGKKPYVRKAKVITVNRGIRRQTRVTL